MTLPQMIDKLHNSGFAVTWNNSHDEAYVSLTNRTVSTMEVVAALNHQPGTAIRSGDCVVIAE